MYLSAKVPMIARLGSNVGFDAMNNVHKFTQCRLAISVDYTWLHGFWRCYMRYKLQKLRRGSCYDLGMEEFFLTWKSGSICRGWLQATTADHLSCDFLPFHKPLGGAYASWPLKSFNRRQCLKTGMLTRPCQLEKDLWAFGKERQKWVKSGSAVFTFNFQVRATLRARAKARARGWMSEGSWRAFRKAKAKDGKGQGIEMTELCRKPGHATLCRATFRFGYFQDF